MSLGPRGGGVQRRSGSIVIPTPSTQLRLWSMSGRFGSRAAGTSIGSRWQAEQSAEVRWRQEHFRFRFPFYSEKEFSLFFS